MDAEAFDRYYAERFGVLVGQVYAMCGNAAEASDCVQEAFVKAWGRREQFGAMANKDAWIRTVARCRRACRVSCTSVASASRSVISTARKRRPNASSTTRSSQASVCTGPATSSVGAAMACWNISVATISR